MVTELVEVRGSPKGDGGRDLGGCPVPMAIGLGRVLPTASCGFTCRDLDVSIFFRQHADIYFKQGAAAPCFDKFIRSNAGSRISPLFEYFYPEQYDRIEYVIVFSYRIRITKYP